MTHRTKVQLWKAALGRVRLATVETRLDGWLLLGCIWRPRIDSRFGEAYFATEREAWDYLLKKYQDAAIAAEREFKNSVKLRDKFTAKYIAYRQAEKQGASDAN